MLGMESIDNFIDICDQLQSCSSIEEVETLKRNLKHSICDKDISTGKRKLKEVIGSSEEGGGEEFQISGKNRSPSVDELTKQVDGLIGEVNELAAPPRPLPIGSMNNENEFDFESRRSVFSQIMEAIKDDGVGMIGIWGMPGIGKTTLVKRVAKYARDEGLFQEVAMAVLSQNPSFKSIQGQIADMIGLTFTLVSIQGRANQLLKRLLARKKPILIVLDDIWERIELNDIGIPSGSQHKGCKVILTSRIRPVCEQMRTEKNFKIDPLSADEALDLFLHMSGVDDQFSENGRLAENLSEECGRLPISIVIVARGLLNKRKVSWEDMLNRLRKSDPDKKVRASIELSYDNLNGEEEKMFFLLCALFPEDYNIPVQVLFEYGLGLDLFQNVNTVDEAVVRSQNLALSLKSQCLLLDEGEENFVKMHDVIRDVALAIASEGKHASLVPGKTATSLWYDDVKKLPDVLECPQLQILILDCSQQYFLLHDNFFAKIKNLIVLHMSFVRIVRLPQTFTALKNLQTLRFSYCNIRDISTIGKLQNLVCLSFYGSYFQVFPKEVGELSNLRLLDLSNCECLDEITPGVFQNLSKLEVLRVGTDIRWSSNSIHLSSGLTILEISIPNTSMLLDDVLLGNLSKFNVSIGKGVPTSQHIFFSNSQILKLTSLEGQPFNAGVQMLIKKAQRLVLEDISWIYIVLSSRLRKYVMPNHGLVGPFFKLLKVLELTRCPNLLVVFPPEAASSLQSLEEICINNCEKLETLFQLDDVGDEMVLFPRLLTLKLVNLPKLTAILTSRRISKATVIFSTTEIMTPCGLHNLESIMDQQLLTFFPKLKKLELEGIGRLPIGCLSTVDPLHVIKGLDAFEELMIKVNNGNTLAQGLLSKLRKLELGFIREPIESCERLDRWFQNLTSLNLFSCNDVKSLLTPSAVNCLVQLQELFVSKCEIVELIVGETSGEQNFDKAIEFSKLRTLKLDNLPRLASFYNGECALKFPCLGDISIEDCPKLKTFASMSREMHEPSCQNFVSEKALFGQQVSLGKLSFLLLERLESMEEIWQRGHPATVVGELIFLDVKGCDRLLKLFPSNLLAGLQNLKELHVQSCKSLEHVFEVEDHPPLLSNLRELRLNDLPELKQFWWNKNNCKSFGLPDLRHLRIESCPTLQFIFDPSVGNFLKGLMILFVENCSSIVEIVAEKPGKMIEFPLLDYLYLANLPCFKVNQSVEFPRVHTVVVCRCFNMEKSRVVNVERDLAGRGRVRYFESFVE